VLQLEMFRSRPQRAMQWQISLFPPVVPVGKSGATSRGCMNNSS
jgi:hypothetical protein